MISLCKQASSSNTQLFVSLLRLRNSQVLRTAAGNSNSNFFRQRRRRAYSSQTPAASSGPDIHDVVIVGGGPAGLTLATALRSSSVTRNMKISLVEGMDLSSSRNWKPQQGCFSNRVSSLTPASVEFLQTIGAWKHIARDRVQDYQEMQVWDGLSDARIEFDWKSAKADRTIAYMCENLNLTHGLLKSLESPLVGVEIGSLTISDKTRVERISLGKDEDGVDLSEWPVVELSDGRKLTARLLVGADGANSPVRAFAEIESRGWDYERHGVVATLSIQEAGDQKVAYQRFLPTGPLALLPLPGNYATMVWSTTPENAAHLKSLPEEEFIALVNAGFRLSAADIAYMHTISSGIAEEAKWRETVTRFPDPPLVPTRITGVQEKTRASFPLKMRHADSYISDRVALVGDAAHTTHPLAGQGLNSGIGDVQSLVRAIEQAVIHGQDIGSLLSLQPYWSERYLTNNAMLGVVDKLHKLYAIQSGPLVPLRSYGLELVNKNWFGVKDFLMRQAAGLGGQV